MSDPFCSGGFTVVGRGGPKSEVRAVHRCAKPLAGMALWVGCRVVTVTGQGVVQVRAGVERGSIVGESGLAPVGRASQGREFGDLAGEWGEGCALDELARHQPLLLAVLDMVLADEGRQEVVEPKQDRDLAGLKACTSGAVVCPLTVDAGSGSQLGRPNSDIPWRRWGASGDGVGVQFQLLHSAAEQLVIALFRHLWMILPFSIMVRR